MLVLLMVIQAPSGWERSALHKCNEGSNGWQAEGTCTRVPQFDAVQCRLLILLSDSSFFLGMFQQQGVWLLWCVVTWQTNRDWHRQSCLDSILGMSHGAPCRRVCSQANCVDLSGTGRLGDT